MSVDLTSQTSALTEELESVRAKAAALATELANERHKLAIVLDSSPTSAAIWRGESFVFEMVNASYQAIFPDRVLLGRELFEAVPELRTQGYPELFAELYETGKPFFLREVKVEMAFREGAPVESRFFDVVHVRLDNRDGTPYGVYNSALDVTDRVTARLELEAQAAELRRTEERTRRIVEAAGVGLWDLDPHAGLIHADHRMVELMGLPLESTFALAAGLDGLASPEDRDRVANAVTAAIGGQNEGRYQIEFRTGGREGIPLRWVESRAQAYFDEEGKVTRLAGAMIDVTARKAAEEERASSVERNTRLLDTMSDGFYAVDPEWRFTAVNRVFERTTRIDRKDVIGMVLWDVFRSSRDEKGPVWTSFHRCMRERVSVEFVSFNTQLAIWVDVRANPTADGGIAVFFRDVTLAKHVEELERQQAAFERQLIGIVSHDLRNPLNAITIAASTLLRRQDELGTRAIKNVLRIQNAAERAGRLIRDLLDFTRARVGGIHVERRPCDFHAVTRTVMDEIEAIHPDRSLPLRAEGDGRGQWDADRLGQVVQNLVTNAVSYSAAGTPVHIVTRGDGDVVVFSVHNLGAPIPAATLPRLFEPFERGAGHRDASARSVGLGLYIVKQVVDSHGGTIDVRSTPEDGTTFTVTIPRRPDARANAPAAR